MTDEPSRYDAAVAEVERRVAEGRASGKYPEELDEQLASEFSRMAKDPLWFRSFAALPEAVDRVRRAGAARAAVVYSSGLPGGAALHRLVEKAVSRQVSAIAQQLSSVATTVASSLDEIVAALEETRTVIQADVLSDLDAVHHRLVAVEHRLARMERAGGPVATPPPLPVPSSDEASPPATPDD